MYENAKSIYQKALQDIREAGLEKEERVITSPQGATIDVRGKKLLNFCANNYLGLASDARILAAAKAALDIRGYGLASVRFICGTQDIHRELECKIAGFFGTEDTILYSSCFDANGGLFETILGEEDAIISDALNHASIIDGIRLSKAKRYVYPNGDMQVLEEKLQEAQSARIRLIATDGVFSMDGYLAKLDQICDLAEKYNALVMVDESHATGFIGKTGRGTPEHFGVQQRIDIITGTLGKALGGGAGGFTTGRAEIIQLLRQRSRPYLFSNTLPPATVGASKKAFEILAGSTELRDRVMSNALRFREGMAQEGFTIPEGIHPIVPIMIGDAREAQEMARDLLDEGIYVIGFSFPVVPKGKARIRVQLSAAHTEEEIDTAIAAFTRVARRRGLLPA